MASLQSRLDDSYTGHQTGQQQQQGDNSVQSSGPNSISHVNRDLSPAASDQNNHEQLVAISSTIDCNNNIIPQELMASHDLIEPSMRRLKKMGWYWGSISPEFAAKLLEDEQDGSFLVRDSSSEFYIFSMTFRLEGQIHHARIEHSKGHYSFGRSRKFFCTTIVDFIEQAIECSHNGNFLFFLHRDPDMEGPVRFRMIPLSRLKCTRSLKHICRFAILPYVRRDKIHELTVPGCLKEYLSEPFSSQIN